MEGQPKKGFLFHSSISPSFAVDFTYFFVLFLLLIWQNHFNGWSCFCLRRRCIQIPLVILFSCCFLLSDVVEIYMRTCAVSQYRMINEDKWRKRLEFRDTFCVCVCVFIFGNCLALMMHHAALNEFRKRVHTKRVQRKWNRTGIFGTVASHSFEFSSPQFPIFSLFAYSDERVTLSTIESYPFIQLIRRRKLLLLCGDTNTHSIAPFAWELRLAK